MPNLLEKLVRFGQQAQRNYRMNTGLAQDPNIPSGNPLDIGSILGNMPTGGNGGGIVPTPEQEAASIAVAQQLGIPPEAPPQEILVQGGPVRKVNPEDYATQPAGSEYLLRGTAPDLDNTDWSQRAIQARQANERPVATEENPKPYKHKGAFGQTGTLRNIMGVVGDAFLINAGRDPMYAPQRHRERVGDAMAGYTANPRAAIERMTAVDPEASAELNKIYGTQEVARQNAESLQRQRAAATYAKGATIFGGMMRAAADNPSAYPQMSKHLKAIKEQYGLGDEFQVPDQYDPNYAAAVANGAIDPYKQERLEDYDQGLGIQQGGLEVRQGQLNVAQQRAAEQARANRVREGLARQRAGRSGGRNPNNASLAAPILEKVRRGQPLTAGESEMLERLDYDLGRGSGRSGRGSGTSTGRSDRFRILNR